MADEQIHEEWRDVEGFPYQVSNFGNVRRSVAASNSPVGYILRPCLDRDGYRCVCLCPGDGTHHNKHISVLVCLAFKGPKPTPKHEVAHWDGVRTNDIASNLRWATPKENGLDRVRHGRMPRGENQHSHKLSETDVREIRKRLEAGGGCRPLAREYGVDKTSIQAIKRGESWRWLL